MSQIRVECCPLLRNYLHRIGRSATATCRGCQEEEETAFHVITLCPAYHHCRRLHLPDPFMFTNDNAVSVHRFLRAIGIAGGDAQQ
jgi:hypothetical protein